LKTLSFDGRQFSKDEPDATMRTTKTTMKSSRASNIALWSAVLLTGLAPAALGDLSGGPAEGPAVMVYNDSIDAIKQAVITTFTDAGMKAEGVEDQNERTLTITGEGTVRRSGVPNEFKGPFGAFFKSPFADPGTTIGLVVAADIRKAPNKRDTKVRLSISAKQLRDRIPVELPAHGYAVLYNAFHTQILHNLPYHERTGT
jgi:hypothetical protein